MALQESPDYFFIPLKRKPSRPVNKRSFDRSQIILKLFLHCWGGIVSSQLAIQVVCDFDCVCLLHGPMVSSMMPRKLHCECTGHGQIPDGTSNSKTHHSKPYRPKILKPQNPRVIQSHKPETMLCIESIPVVGFSGCPPLQQRLFLMRPETQCVPPRVGWVSEGASHA